MFDNATDKLIIAQNLIGRCDNSGVFAITRPDRSGSGTGTGNGHGRSIRVHGPVSRLSGGRRRERALRSPHSGKR
ncbi:MAG TPA: hypothetical protein VHC69_16190 [Polyangiaceae bacterium]|jgi:hypothetical protein|nr:hypothetical protein [Polyangiaceae bacterium]